MRFLKTKILRAQEALLNKQKTQSSIILDNSSSDRKEVSQVERSPPTSKISKEKSDEYNKSHSRRSLNCAPEIPTVLSNDCFKNIIINYGKAVLSFAASDFAIPYIKSYMQNESLNLNDFKNFVIHEKNKIGGIAGFRSMLLVSENDEEKTKACKRLLQWLGEVFIKCFSVNWIMTGKVTHKLLYLKYRFKILRGICDPENFTQIRNNIRKKPVSRI